MIYYRKIPPARLNVPPGLGVHLTYNYGRIKKRILCHIDSFLNSKRIELESPTMSYVEEIFKGFSMVIYFLIFHKFRVKIS